MARQRPGECRFFANVDQLIHDIVTSSSRTKLINTVAPTSGKSRVNELEELLVQEQDPDKHFTPGSILVVASDAPVPTL